MSFESKRDYYAGALVALIGASAAYQGSTYGIGTMAQMEPGYFPTALGILMILVGAAIAATGAQGTESLSIGVPPDPHHAASTSFDWRGWLAIISGVCLFMGLAEYAGLLPAIFACVFVSALGCRTTTWKEALVLALCVTAFGIALFNYGLQVPIPILRGI
jgi:hypothetical protein